MIQTKYRDKDNNLIEIGNKLIDEENFIWLVKEDKQGVYLECEDLLARDKVYPRAKYCRIER